MAGQWMGPHLVPRAAAPQVLEVTALQTQPLWAPTSSEATPKGCWWPSSAWAQAEGLWALLWARLAGTVHGGGGVGGTQIHQMTQGHSEESWAMVLDGP